VYQRTVSREGKEPSTQEAEQELQKTGLGYIVRTCSKIKAQKRNRNGKDNL
jgi:hypothetical protein